MRHAPERREIVQVEIVARIDAKASFMRVPGSGRVLLQARGELRAPGLESARKRLGIELHAIGTEVRRPVDRRRFGVDEHADADARRLKLADDLSQIAGGRRCRPSRLARDLSRCNRHQCALIRLHLVHQREEITARIAFDVELDASAIPGKQLGQLPHVRERDVPRIRARVDRNALDPDVDTHLGRLEDGRYGPAARIADGCDLIDVDGKIDHRPVLHTAARILALRHWAVMPILVSQSLRSRWPRW